MSEKENIFDLLMMELSDITDAERSIGGEKKLISREVNSIGKEPLTEGTTDPDDKEPLTEETDPDEKEPLTEEEEE